MAEMWHLNTQKYTNPNLFSLARKNRLLYKKITPILMVKILDFNCEKLLTKSYYVYVFSDLHFFGIFTRNMFSIKLQCNIDNLKSKYLIKYNIEMYFDVHLGP